MTIRTLIVDDELPARRRLRRFLAREPGIEIVGGAASGAAAVDAIRTLAPALLFLDVQMPQGDGFSVLRTVGAAAMPVTVFVTAHDEHAVEAFEIGALDYLLKPFTDARFQLVLDRARGRIDAPAGAERARLAELERRIADTAHLLVDDGGRVRLLPVDAVLRVEANRNYCVLHTADGRFEQRTTLSALAAKLDPARFLQINRGELIRADQILELVPWSHGDYRVRLRGGAETTWTRRYRDRAPGVYRGER